MKNIISAIFSNYTPERFGLCGEAFLWEDFRSHFLARPDIETEENFVTEMKSTFKTLTGVSIMSKPFVFVERFSRGGMSSGMVDPWNWSSVIVPDIILRFNTCKNC